MKDPKQVINDIQAEFGVEDRRGVSFANSLDVISTQIYASGDRFVYELIQNACDASGPGGVEIIFRLTADSELYFSHNGRPFDENDLWSLCSVGESSKRRERSSIGYKGIGFKSVFGQSSCVRIISGKYDFRFDKSFWRERKVPWQILPIFCEDVDVPCIHAASVHTTTILKLDNNQHVLKALKNIRERPESAIFLNGMKSLAVETPGDSFVLSRDDDDDMCVVKLNGDVYARFIVRTFDVPIPDSIKVQLAQDENIPEKLKDLESVGISFAWPLTEDFLPIGKTCSLYSFFPMDENIGSEVMLNSSFVTTASREALDREHYWNRYLLEASGEYLVKWIRELAETDRRDIMFSLVPKEEGAESSLQSIVDNALKLSLVGNAIIPAAVGEQMLLCTEAFIDNTDLFRHLGWAEYREDSGAARYRAASELKYMERLKRYGLKELTIANLPSIAQVYVDEFVTPEHNLSIAKHFEQRYPEPEKTKSLLETSWILDGGGQLGPPGGMLYSGENPIDATLLSGTERVLAKIHEEELLARPEYCTWLEKSGVHKTSPASIVRKFLLPGLSSGKIDLEQGERWLEVVFSAYPEIDLKKNEKQLLGGLKVASSSGEHLPLSMMWLGIPYITADYWGALEGEGTRSLSFLSSELSCRANKDSSIRYCLLDLGVTLVSEAELIEKVLLPKLELKSPDVQDWDYWVGVVLLSRHRNTYSDVWNSKLRQMCVHTRANTLVKVCVCWIGAPYVEDSELDALLGNTDAIPFLHEKYKQHEDIIQAVKDLGARETVEVVTKAGPFTREDVEHEYIKWLDTNYRVDPMYYGYIGQHRILNWQEANVPLANIVNSDTQQEYARFIIKKILSWSDRSVFHSIYSVNRGYKKYTVPSWLSMKLIHEPVWPCKDGQCHSASDILTQISDSLASLLPNNPPVLDIDISDIPQELLDYLPFNEGLTIEQCLQLLDGFANVGDASPASTERICQIYDILLDERRAVLHGDQRLRDRFKEMKIITRSGSFEMASELYLPLRAEIAGLYLPEETMECFEYDDEKLEGLAGLFGVTVVKDLDVSITAVEPEKATDIKDLIWKRRWQIALLMHGKGTFSGAVDCGHLEECINDLTYIGCKSYVFAAEADTRTVEASYVCHIDKTNQTVYLKGDRNSSAVLFSFAKKFSEHIGLPKMYGEMHLMLVMATEESLMWLENEGYPVGILPPPEEEVPDIVEPDRRTSVLKEDKEAVDVDLAEVVMADPASVKVEYAVRCVSDDYQTDTDTGESIRSLLDMLERQESVHAGFIYHFTHVENLIRIIRAGKLVARSYVEILKDSAGPGLIARTSDRIKEFVRFYFRPHTPTQWHNECLGRSAYGIRALCPVPVFMKLWIKEVALSVGSRWAVSNGNLASQSSHYGNTVDFLKYFDANNLYKSFREVSLGTFLAASQQEFLVERSLSLAGLEVELLCRTEQDQYLVSHLVGQEAGAMGANMTVSVAPEFFLSENPSLSVNRQESGCIAAKLLNARKDMEGHFVLKLVRGTGEEPLNIEFDRRLHLRGEPLNSGEIYYRENDENWLVYRWSS